jgi:hypothetical protein
MNKRYFLALFSLGFCLNVFGQNVTNNNTIIINGDVYYFRPATTPSSPQPRVGSGNFISYGRWYGEDAAKAWASIADWAIEHCEDTTSPIRGSRDEIVYISSVEAGKGYGNQALYNHKITIYYWVVKRGDRMEDGRRATREFRFK